MRSRFHVLIALILLGLPIVTATAQGPRRPSQPIQGALRAIIEGRYEQVDGLLAEVDAADPDAVALKSPRRRRRMPTSTLFAHNPGSRR